MTDKAEDRASFQQQPPAGGNDLKDKKGLANREVNETHPDDTEHPDQPGKAPRKD